MIPMKENLQSWECNKETNMVMVRDCRLTAKHGRADRKIVCLIALYVLAAPLYPSYAGMD